MLLLISFIKIILGTMYLLFLMVHSRCWRRYKLCINTISVFMSLLCSDRRNKTHRNILWYSRVCNQCQIRHINKCFNSLEEARPLGYGTEPSHRFTNVAQSTKRKGLEPNFKAPAISTQRGLAIYEGRDMYPGSKHVSHWVVLQSMLTKNLHGWKRNQYGC